MRQIVRYRFMTIPSKMVGEIRITVDDKSAEYGSLFDGGKATNITLYPVINIQLLKASTGELNDAGLKTRVPWDPNDSIGLTKFSLPIFLNELKDFQEGMKTPDLYTYIGTRLELNEEKANIVRKVFMVGQTTIEFCPIMVEQTDGTRIEAAKIKFNTEKSSVVLTLNELTAFSYNLDHLDIDSITFMMYNHYIQKDKTVYRNVKQASDIDIAPVSKKDLVQKEFTEFV